MGLSGIPICNVNNNCSTGSTALFMARNLVLTGLYQAVLAVGFEKMTKGLPQLYTDAGYTSPVGKHFDSLFQFGASKDRIGALNDMTGNVIKMFAYAAMEHQQKYNTTNLHFAKISYKNHKHSVNNPYAQVQKEFPIESILDPAYTLCGPITSLQASPVADGAAAVILCSKQFVDKFGLQSQAVQIMSQILLTDLPSSFESQSFINLCGYQITHEAAKRAFAEAQLSPQDVDVVEVHDCFSCNELLTYEALGLCKEGEGGDFVDSGVWLNNQAGAPLFHYPHNPQTNKRVKYVVVNPSGGLESKGHPIGATGVAQCVELCWQLRGKAEKRQVDGAQVGLQHNFGLGSAVVITLYKKYNPLANL